MNYQITHLKPFGAMIEPKVKNASLNEIDIESMRDLFRKEHLLIFRGFDSFKNAAHFSDYCETWGQICLWPFGKVLDLIQQDNPEDHIFDHSYIPLHWDGMYRPQVPEYQIFNCVTAPLAGQGGRTTFSNTVLALENAAPELIVLWNKVTGIYQRKMEFYNSRTVSPIITKHPHRNFSVIRYNEPPRKEQGHFVNPPDLEFSGVNQSDLENFHIALRSSLYDPRNFYAHEWHKGDVVVADNFTLLHGREAFVSKSPRHIQRVQVLSAQPFNNPGLESYK